jgi:hypothetical protein
VDVVGRIAGSDTTSNSSCAITFWITKYPEAHAKLVQELDEKFKDYDGVLDYNDVKELRYLDACINVRCSREGSRDDTGADDRSTSRKHFADTRRVRSDFQDCEMNTSEEGPRSGRHVAD